MPLILNIDTAVTAASICIARGKELLIEKRNLEQKESAAWLHVAIKESLQELDLQPNDLQAIAVTSGPGSYTGLRVSMAAAKGLCYALNIPLITLNTLKVMANAAKGQHRSDLLCPMIDARRMEVFTAIFNHQLEEISPAKNLILDETSFSEQLEHSSILFFGNGAEKFKNINRHPNAKFTSVESFAVNMTDLSNESFEAQIFADLAYSEPFYGKDFHTTAKQSL